MANVLVVIGDRKICPYPLSGSERLGTCAVDAVSDLSLQRVIGMHENFGGRMFYSKSPILPAAVSFTGHLRLIVVAISRSENTRQMANDGRFRWTLSLEHLWMLALLVAMGIALSVVIARTGQQIHAEATPSLHEKRPPLDHLSQLEARCCVIGWC